VAGVLPFLSDPRCSRPATAHRLPADQHGAFQLTEKSGFYKENPGTDVAVTQMIRKVTDKSRGIRLGNFVQIRTSSTRRRSRSGPARGAEAALEDAIKRGNEHWSGSRRPAASSCVTDGRQHRDPPPAPLRQARAADRGALIAQPRWKSASASAPLAAVGVLAPQLAYRRVLLLAGEPGAAAVAAAAGPLRHVDRVGRLENFRVLFADDSYLGVVPDDGGFSLLVAGFGIAISLLLAVFADRVAPARCSTRPADAGRMRWRRRSAAVLWSSCSRPGWAWSWACPRSLGLEPLLDAREAMG